MKKMPNIILVVMDTVRADHLSCYSHHQKTTPNIDSVAKHGVLYENAFSVAPWTPPSHASIFTGKYPSYHRTLGKNLHLGRENVTLAEILRRCGYVTMGISACPFLRPEEGFNKGFHEYFDMYKMPTSPSFTFAKQSLRAAIRKMIFGPDRYVYQTNDMIKNLLKANRLRKRPFFLFVNYFNCHTPYDPPRPFKKRFCNSYDESALYLIDFILKRIFRKTTEKIHDKDLDIQRILYIAGGKASFSFIAKEFQISKKEWEVVKSWYDGEIAYLDYRIGELINFLCDEGIFDDTFLIITSDHGENLGQHDLPDHTFCLYDSVLHVPLIMTYPSVIPEKRTISNLVSTIDIFPTILTMLDLKNIGDNIQGKSLYPFEEQNIHNFVCAEYGGYLSRLERLENVFVNYPKIRKIEKGLKSIRTESYKYILSSDQKEELYNVQDDPFEEVNIARGYPDKARFLRKQLENTVDISYFGAKEFPAEKERQILDRLKALGYVES